MSADHQCYGVPLERYQLSRADHRGQQEAVDVAAWVAEQIAKAPRMSDEQLETILEMLREPRPPVEKMTWRVRLYCGHIREVARPRSWLRPYQGTSGKETCGDCGLDPALIVAFEPLEADSNQGKPA
ncbi:hypothetical protein AB0O76_43460 [Streptomyces sp. NPDC086554]|uniref:hypothetical protein n=1 Tax=Streptomyces sp. NPDC086554 TaxID=3154864 RepID=UPI00342FF6DD